MCRGFSSQVEHMGLQYASRVRRYFYSSTLMSEGECLARLPHMVCVVQERRNRMCSLKDDH